MAPVSVFVSTALGRPLASQLRLYGAGSHFTSDGTTSFGNAKLDTVLSRKATRVLFTLRFFAENLLSYLVLDTVTGFVSQNTAVKGSWH